MSLLVKRRANLEGSTGTGETPLHLACLYNHKSVFSSLIRLKANVGARAENGWTPLHVASVLLVIAWRVSLMGDVA